MIYMFDLDGTLVYSKEFIMAIYKESYENSKLYIKSFAKELDYLKSHTINQYLEYLEVEPMFRYNYSVILSKNKNLLFDKYMYTLKPNEELCKLLQNNLWSSYIVTNASKETSVRYLAFLNLSVNDHRIYSRERLKEPKPSGDAYKTVIDEQNIEISKVIVFEDSNEGILSATKAGITNIKKVSFDSTANSWSIITWK